MEENDSARDLDLAAHVQKILFPKASPVCEWGEIGFQNRMAHGVGGDYFDFLTMSDTCQIIFLGDVTGRGVHASLIMALLYGFIHHAFRNPCPCQDIVRQINNFLLTFTSRSRRFDQFFSTMLFYGIINPETQRMTYVNAGHPAPLVRRGDFLFTLPVTSRPLGYFPDPEIATASISLQEEDRLLLYTDGIIEATNKDGEFFGEERLERMLLQSEQNNLEFLDKLFRTLTKFTGKDSPEDDCTAIVVDFKGHHRR
ncbi:MAG: PP2C family protein-serine/threonine phosphatase [Pedobacter sp.]